MSSGKPFSIYKHGFSNPHPWSRNLQCNAYMSNGKAALKCPEYKKRRNHLETIVGRISSMEVNQKTFDVSILDSARPAFLRRNAFKVKSKRPNFNEKKNRWYERLEAAAVDVKKEKYTVCVKFYYHLETLHGYESFDLTSLEPVHCSTYMPSRSMELVPMNQSQRSSRTMLPDYYSDHFNNGSLEFVMGRSAEKLSRKSPKFPMFEIRGDIGLSNKRKRTSLPAITTGRNEEFADMTAPPGSFSFIGTILQMPDDNALLRSFYTCYHSGRLTECDPEEADYENIEQLAMSDLVNYSIENPPPDGLKLKEYSQDEFYRMPKATQNCLRRWRNALLPALADCSSSEGYQSGYEDDDENVIEIWNREVRKVQQRSFGEPAKKRPRINESFESVRSLPEPTARQVMMEEIIERRMTRRVVHTSGMSDLRQIDNDSTMYSTGSNHAAYMPKSKGPKIVELNNNDNTTSVVRRRSEQPKYKRRSPRYNDENNPNLSTSVENKKSVAATPATQTSRGRSLPDSVKTKTPATRRSVANAKTTERSATTAKTPARRSGGNTKTPARKSPNTSKVSTPSTVDVFRRLPVNNRKPFAELNTPVRRSPRLSRLQVL